MRVGKLLCAVMKSEIHADNYKRAFLCACEEYILQQELHCVTHERHDLQFESMLHWIELDFDRIRSWAID